MKSGNAAGEISPLLPAVKSPATEGGGASVSGAVFNLATSIIGAGIMSIPATLKVLGVGPAIVLIFAVAYMCDVSTDFLLRYTQSGGSTTYAGVMAESFGKLGSLALQICIMVTTMGCLIIYLIIIGDVLSGAQSEGTVHLGVLQEWFGVHWWNTRAFALLIVALFVMLPLLLLRRVVHPIRYELHKLSDMTTAVRISLILCAIIYAAVGFFGYLLFGDSTMADILSNFDRNSDSATGAVLNDIVRLSYALHLMLVYPLLNFSLRINVDGLIFPKSQSLASNATRFLLITAFLIGFAYTAAIAFPNIWSLFQFVGSTSAVCIAFIFPGAIVLRDVHGISTRRDRIFAATMIIVAVIASAIAITTNIIKLITPTT